uniref:Uncharacterized protein n=1 Tax=Anguilla anguilla TaxID=7936 RepID=A0A0E9QC69_ANGAN
MSRTDSPSAPRDNSLKLCREGATKRTIYSSLCLLPRRLGNEKNVTLCTALYRVF